MDRDSSRVSVTDSRGDFSPRNNNHSTVPLKGRKVKRTGMSGHLEIEPRPPKTAWHHLRRRIGGKVHTKIVFSKNNGELPIRHRPKALVCNALRFTPEILGMSCYIEEITWQRTGTSKHETK
jgi:hypothetical protein